MVLRIHGREVIPPTSSRGWHERHDGNFGTQNVRYWHLADILTDAFNVRFWGESGHDFLRYERPLLTQSGHSAGPPMGTVDNLRFPY